jgi:acyl carrier protein
MGLEMIEIALAVEEEFGIDLPDSELGFIRTPADLIDLICGLLATQGRPRCLSQQAFYRLRKGLVETTGVTRGDIRPDSRLAELAPGRNVRDWWTRLQNCIGARSWPALDRPRWLRRVIWGIAFASCACTVGWFFSKLGWRGLVYGLISGLPIAVATGAVLLGCTRMLKYALPDKLQTVADLIPAALTSPCIDWKREDVAARVKEIVSVQLNLKESEYSEEKRFIEDLGAG